MTTLLSRTVTVAALTCVVSIGPSFSQSDVAEPEPARQPPDPEVVAARLDAFTAPLVDEDQLSGRLVVRLADGTLIDRTFGWADRELGVPVTDDTVFNIASVTKTMTVVALARSLEEGKLALSDPISRWLPDFPRAEEITVEMLARHRAGIPHRVTEPEMETVPRTAADMVSLAAAAGLTFEPGSEESYSSAGYSVLARVLELAGGASYARMLERSVFEPAGMTSSAHADSGTILPGRAASYLLAPSGEIRNAPLKDLSFLVGAGSVWSTASDLERLATTIRQGGFGALVRSELVGESGLRSNGLTSGFRAFVDWHREGDVTVAFTGNLVTGAADLIRSAVPKLAAGETVPPPSIPDMEPVAVPDATLRSYEGMYQLRPGRDLAVEALDGGLRIGEWVLIPIGDATFVSPQDYATITIEMGDDGRPVGMRWTGGGTTSELPWTGRLDEAD